MYLKRLQTAQTTHFPLKTKDMDKLVFINLSVVCLSNPGILKTSILRYQLLPAPGKQIISSLICIIIVEYVN